MIVELENDDPTVIGGQYFGLNPLREQVSYFSGQSVEDRRHLHKYRKSAIERTDTPIQVKMRGRPDESAGRILIEFLPPMSNAFVQTRRSFLGVQRHDADRGIPQQSGQAGVAPLPTQSGLPETIDRLHRPCRIAVYVERKPEIDQVARHRDQCVRDIARNPGTCPLRSR